MNKCLRVIAVMFLIASTFLFAIPAHATGDPTSDPYVIKVKANINLIETGDVLIYGEYDFPYTDIPGDSAADTYNIRLIDTDNVTQLGAVTPFVLFDNGYNLGVFSLYFSADDNLDIDEAYIIRISQSPAYFVTPESYSYTMSGWTSKTTHADNQVELAINVIAMARDLQVEHNTTLLESGAAGTILSDPTGDTYFRGAIYGLQSMAPALFMVQVLQLDTTTRAWTTAQFDNYTEQFEDTWLGVSTENTSATYGLTTPTLMSFIFLLPVIAACIILSHFKFKKTQPGLMVAALAMIGFALLGWISAALFATVFQLMAMYIGYLLFYSRSS